MISVCMATFNGERFLRQQMESILSQLSSDDEVLVSDDGSTDNTMIVLESFRDSRIRIFKNSFHSPIKNFEFLVAHANGDIIITSDQDDLWLDGRVKEVVRMHREDNVTLVICKAQTINSNGELIRESFFADDDPVAHSLLYNLYRNPFLGCCLSMKRELLPYILPYPPKIAMHDIWMGLVAQKYFTVAYYGERPLVQYRRYGLNYTSLHRYGFLYKIQYRLYFLIELCRRGRMMHRK